MKYDKTQTTEEHNKILFDKFRTLNLPTSEYAIVSSGPLAIRGIKKTRDVDVIVSEKLWNELSTKHTVVKGNKENTKENKKVDVIKPKEDIDILRIYTKLSGQPTLNEQVQSAEIIDGLSFQALSHCLWFKKKSDRQKDKDDIGLVKEYLSKHPEELENIDLDL
jgi:hypothetical protein